MSEWESVSRCALGDGGEGKWCGCWGRSAENNLESGKLFPRSNDANVIHACEWCYAASLFQSRLAFHRAYHSLPPSHWTVHVIGHYHAASPLFLVSSRRTAHYMSNALLRRLGHEIASEERRGEERRTGKGEPGACGGGRGVVLIINNSA